MASHVRDAPNTGTLLCMCGVITLFNTFQHQLESSINFGLAVQEMKLGRLLDTPETGIKVPFLAFPQFH